MLYVDVVTPFDSVSKQNFVASNLQTFETKKTDSNKEEDGY